jgi:cholesterol transport system auxiliary component
MTAGLRPFANRRTLLPLACALLMSSCALQTPTSDTPTRYDFGPPPSHAQSNPGIPATLLVTAVRAPSWLDETGIVYRLLHEDSSRPRLYAMSAWSASPAALITDRIYGRFAAASQGAVGPGFSAQSDYTVRVELEDFSQHFTAQNESRVFLKARASLLSSVERRLLAQRQFEFARPAEPNAPGAVKSLTEAVDGFTDELVRWTADNVRAAQVRSTASQAK